MSLRTDGLTVRYGDLTVLDDVSLEITGAAVGIVGPNGAGKTTLLDALAGSVRPAAGTVELDGRDVTRLRPDRRCRLGIGRAFQVPRPFPGLTVLENVMVAATYGAGLQGRAADRQALDVLDRCALTGLADRRADSLGLLYRKRLELARCLATGPSIVLLDEIGAGLTEAESAELVDAIRDVRAGGVTIVWIEHIVHVLVQVVDRLVCMDTGRIIADGPPADVLADAVVVDAYLGRAGG